MSLYRYPASAVQLALIILTTLPVTTAKNTRFNTFFPAYRKDFTEIRDGVCATQYALQNTPRWDCNAMLDCMIDNTREYIKGDLASGIVALGLLPTILTLLGSTTAETVLLARRRPVLALLLATGSPSVNPIRKGTYGVYEEELGVRDGEKPLKIGIGNKWGWLVVGVEFLVAAAAVGNVYAACWEVGDRTVNTVSCDDDYYTTVWALLAVVIHGLGCLALGLRVREKETGKEGWEGKGRAWSNWEWVQRWWRYESRPCVTHDKLELEWKHETMLFMFISWFLSVGTVAHLLYGTVAFSSLQFMGYLDSLRIIGRLFGSAIACRGVVMFELAGMRNATGQSGGSSSGEHLPLRQLPTTGRSSGLDKGQEDDGDRRPIME